MLAKIVATRITPLLGVTVSGHGALAESEHGHPAGTPFVLVQADCTDEAYYAEETLADVARIRGDWHGGWSGRRISGDYVLERKIFPTLELLAERDPASA